MENNNVIKPLFKGYIGKSGLIKEKIVKFYSVEGWQKKPALDINKVLFDNELKFCNNSSILLDLKSHNLVCIDCDGPAASEAFKRIIKGMRLKVYSYETSTAGHTHHLMKRNEWNTSKIGKGRSFVDEEIEVLIENCLVVCEGKARINFDELINFLNDESKSECLLSLSNYFDDSLDLWKAFGNFHLISGYKKIVNGNFEPWDNRSASISGRNDWITCHFVNQLMRVSRSKLDSEAFKKKQWDSVNDRKIIDETFRIMIYGTGEDPFDVSIEKGVDGALKLVNNSNWEGKPLYNSKNDDDSNVVIDENDVIKLSKVLKIYNENDYYLENGKWKDLMSFQSKNKDLIEAKKIRLEKLSELSGIKDLNVISKIKRLLKSKEEEPIKDDVLCHFINGYIGKDCEFHEEQVFSIHQLFHSFKKELFNGEIDGPLKIYLEKMCRNKDNSLNEQRIKSLLSILGTLMVKRSDSVVGLIYSLEAGAGKTSLLDMIGLYCNHQKIYDKIIYSREGSLLSGQNGTFMVTGVGASALGCHFKDSPARFSHHGINWLKEISGDSITRNINDKNVNQYEVRNFLNVVIDSNHEISFGVGEKEVDQAFKTRLVIVECQSLVDQFDNLEPFLVDNFKLNLNIQEQLVHKCLWYYCETIKRSRSGNGNFRAKSFLWDCNDTSNYFKEILNDDTLKNEFEDVVNEFKDRNVNFDVTNRTLKNIRLDLIKDKIIHDSVIFKSFKERIIKIIELEGYIVKEVHLDKFERGLRCERKGE